MEKRERLAECEELVMSILWSAGEDLNLMAVAAEAKEKYGRDWKLQTVATLMARLKEKGYISIYKAGRHSHYHPEVGLDEYRREKLQEASERLFGGSRKEMADFIRRM